MELWGRGSISTFHHMVFDYFSCRTWWFTHTFTLRLVCLYTFLKYGPVSIERFDLTSCRELSLLWHTLYLCCNCWCSYNAVFRFQHYHHTVLHPVTWRLLVQTHSLVHACVYVCFDFLRSERSYPTCLVYYFFLIAFLTNSGFVGGNCHTLKKNKIKML